jgi:hypothetical protein
MLCGLMPVPIAFETKASTPAAAQALRRHQITALGAQFVLGVRQRCDRTGIADLPRQRATATTDPS